MAKIHGRGRGVSPSHHPKPTRGRILKRRGWKWLELGLFVGGKKKERGKAAWGAGPTT